MNCTVRSCAAKCHKTVLFLLVVAVKQSKKGEIFMLKSPPCVSACVLSVVLAVEVTMEMMVSVIV